MGEVSTPRLQFRDHILSVPTGAPASISWINAVPRPLSCPRTHRAKDTDWRKGQRPCHCAVNTNSHPGWQEPLRSEPAVCTLSAIHVQLAHWLSLKKGHLYPLVTPRLLVTHRAQRRAGQPCWQQLPFPPRACRLAGQTHRPQTGLTLSCTWQRENKVKHHLCQRLCSSDRKQNWHKLIQTTGLQFPETRSLW